LNQPNIPLHALIRLSRISAEFLSQPAVHPKKYGCGVYNTLRSSYNHGAATATADHDVTSKGRPHAQTPSCVLAHDTSHVSAKRTKQRLQPTFHWPTIRRDVNDYRLSCVQWQLGKRKTYLDRTPIRAI